MASRDKRIPFKNESGEAIPPYAVIEFAEDCDVNAGTGAITVKARKPSGQGPYALNTEKPVAASGEASFGECIIPLESLWWARYTEEDPPETAWETEVGPLDDDWVVSEDGTGFVYAGLHEPENERILVKSVPDVAPQPYFITEYDQVNDRDVLIWRDVSDEYTDTYSDVTGAVRLAKVKMTRAKWSDDYETYVLADTSTDFEEVDVHIDFLNGFTATGQLAMVKTIAGKKQWVGGWSGTYVWYCRVGTENIPEGEYGEVTVLSRVNGQQLPSRPINTYPIVRVKMRVHEEALLAYEYVSLVFDDMAQQFDVLKVSCPVE